MLSGTEPKGAGPGARLGQGGPHGSDEAEIIRHGEVVNWVGSADAQPEELRLDFELDAGRGLCIAARAESSDQSSAFTHPVDRERFEGLA